MICARIHARRDRTKFTLTLLVTKYTTVIMAQKKKKKKKKLSAHKGRNCFMICLTLILLLIA